MGTRRRLAKKQRKQDKFVTTTFELARFFEEHVRKAIISLAIFAIAIGGALYYWNYRSHKETRAARLLLDASAAYEAGNYPLTISDLEKFRQGFLGTKHGDEAMFLLADSYYQDGNYEEAQGILARFTDRYDGSSQLAYKAHLLLGCTLENLESFGEAAEAYLRASKLARFDYQRVRARFDAARAFSQAGDRSKALEEYRYVLNNYPEEQAAGQAAVLIAEIEAVAIPEVE